MIVQINDKKQKRSISRKILEALDEWFEVEESRERYIRKCADWLFFAAQDNNENVGFLCLKETGKETVELAVMGVLKQYHRQGLGRAMFEQAKKEAIDKGYQFMQVKTVKAGVYEEYDITNLFYRSLGFKEFEVIDEIWGEDNPCQIYVMSLR